MSFYRGSADIIIKNGVVVDGSGNLPFYADVAIKGDRIDYIGNLQDVNAPLVIDAHHKYVTPGFIDPHTHGDFNIWGNPEAQSSVRQGVTTEIMGNCGFSMRSNMEAQDAIEFAAAASCLKHTIEYDYNMVTVKEVEALVNGKGNGRVQR